MNEFLTFLRDLSSGRVTLSAVLVFLLILELAVRRKATRKRPLS